MSRPPLTLDHPVIREMVDAGDDGPLADFLQDQNATPGEVYRLYAAADGDGEGGISEGCLALWLESHGWRPEATFVRSFRIAWSSGGNLWALSNSRRDLVAAFDVYDDPRPKFDNRTLFETTRQARFMIKHLILSMACWRKMGAVAPATASFLPRHTRRQERGRGASSS